MIGISLTASDMDALTGAEPRSPFVCAGESGARTRRDHHGPVAPPSVVISYPTTNSALRLYRNSTIEAISSGLPARPIGMPFGISA